MKYSSRFYFLFFKKLGFKKIANILVNETGRIISNITRKNIRIGYPFGLSIEVSGSCQLKCPECPIGQRETGRFGFIDEQLFRRAVDQTAPYLAHLFLNFQGEPFLHPKIFELIRYSAIEKKIFTSCSTNGQYDLLPEQIILSGLDRIIFSVDGTDEDVYAAYRVGGSLKQILDNIEKLVSTRKKLGKRNPDIVMQMVVTSRNEHQINQFRELATRMGVDAISLKSAQLYDYRKGHVLIPKNQNFSRYKPLPAGTFEIKSTLPNTCRRLWNTSVISVKGEILPCCYDKKAEFPFGNIIEKNIKKILNSDTHTKFRQQILLNRKQIEMCNNCTEGLNTRY